VPMGTPFDTFTEAARTANAEGRVRRYREGPGAGDGSEGCPATTRVMALQHPLEGAVPFDPGHPIKEPAQFP
jgi:hypothetical protein